MPLPPLHWAHGVKALPHSFLHPWIPHTAPGMQLASMRDKRSWGVVSLVVAHLHGCHLEVGGAGTYLKWGFQDLPSRLMNSDYVGMELSFCIFNKLLKQFFCIGNWRTDLLFILPRSSYCIIKTSKAKIFRLICCLFMRESCWQLRVCTLFYTLDLNTIT